MSSACSAHARPVFRSIARRVARPGRSSTPEPSTRSRVPERTRAPPRSSARTVHSVEGDSSRRIRRSGGIVARKSWRSLAPSISVSSRRIGSSPSQYVRNAWSSTRRSTAASTSSCGSRSSRPATSSSTALCASLPAAERAETPEEILRALADPERLAIAGALAQTERTSSQLAEGLGLPIARIRKHLNRLTSTGVVRLEPDRRSYRLDPETLRWAAEQVGPPREAGLALGAASEDEETVLRTFFRNGRLTEIPAKASKRRVVLERVAMEFEPGVRYPEKEVNAIVGRLFTDHASLRRYLVDEGFLARERGIYWRSGGRVDV